VRPLNPCRTCHDRVIDFRPLAVDEATARLSLKGGRRAPPSLGAYDAVFKRPLMRTVGDEAVDTAARGSIGRASSGCGTRTGAAAE
jgi:hypothetical protein